MYVEGLIGPETVNTMPAATIEAFQDHGRVAKTLTEGLPEAEQLLRDLEGVGISYDEVVACLERGGVESFVRSFGFLSPASSRSVTVLPRPTDRQRGPRLCRPVTRQGS